MGDKMVILGIVMEIALCLVFLLIVICATLLMFSHSIVSDPLLELSNRLERKINDWMEK